MKVVLIKYKAKYDDCESIVDIAINRDVANQHIKYLAEKYPYAYGKEYGTYYLETYNVIEEVGANENLL